MLGFRDAFFPTTIILKAVVAVVVCYVGGKIGLSALNELQSLSGDLKFIREVLYDTKNLSTVELIKVKNFELTHMWDKYMVGNLSAKFGSRLSEEEASFFVKYCVLHDKDVSKDVSFMLSSTPGFFNPQ